MCIHLHLLTMRLTAFQPSFYALYRSFTECLFVEEDGDIVFYKNKEGKAVREVDPAYLKRPE